MIENKTDLTLRGTHRDSVVILRAAGTPNNKVVENIQIDNSHRIDTEHFTIDGRPGLTDFGIVIDGCIDVVIQHMRMTEIGGLFVLIRGGENTTIIDNEFSVGGDQTTAGATPPYLYARFTRDVAFGRNTGVWSSAG